MITTTGPLKIAVVGSDERNRKVLHIVFEGPGKGLYALIEDTAAADACIFDMDAPAGADNWQAYRVANPSLPTLVVSQQPQSEYPRTLYLKKPYQIQTLFKSLKQLRIIRAAQGISQPGDASAASPALPPGRSSEADLSRNCVAGKQVYHPQEYLQGVLENALQYARAHQQCIRLKQLPGEIMIIPRLKKVFTRLRDADLYALSVMPSGEYAGRLQLSDEAEQLRLMETQEPAPAMPLEQFQWKISLWASHGRLPQNTALDAPARLRYWPNFTRLPLPPQALEIAALWQRQPLSINQACQRLPASSRCAVFAFYSAALGAGMLEIATPDAVAAPPPAAPCPAGKAGMAQFFGKILRHLWKE
jgi:hypothetical protein